MLPDNVTHPNLDAPCHDWRAETTPRCVMAGTAWPRQAWPEGDSRPRTFPVDPMGTRNGNSDNLLVTIAKSRSRGAWKAAGDHDAT